MTVRQDVHSAGIPVLCQSCEARHHGVCGALDPDQLVGLAKTSSKHTVEAGVELIGDAEAIDSYANVLSGVVKLTKSLSDGRQQIVGLQFAPDFLGRPFKVESAINAEAATAVSLCSFPRAVIERMMKQSPGLEHRLFKQTLNELDDARDWMVMLGRKSASEKVASFLLMIAKNIDPTLDPTAQSTRFDLPLTRADIADFLGLTIETVSRQLSRLRSDGVIRIENNRHVSVDSLNRLQSRSGA
ncbi:MULTISPECIES: Crp/Fnr family transcriptional regulator [unclassified Mesorhizobium]|uniref:Crp/Fnr family transcriptional regulator n=1 Tax=unclassified Mesorhizobium TaxID=325217 RepID=UPI00112DB783|nr:MULTISPECIES: Crp/Fnr family transcriptional regulator [unclassified Mesorhizobium]TPJ40960.1 Crp/Fnr family transcriptional regulator [Mesorhizobium sp. B2-6-6]MCA0008668.1 Crp/Fnr family transcriptional regulator [Mesorhizobium sp. B264B1B]MCA0019454.1 Crp/Fnr family transcriptional regulator [Mesorhizobium sp. B264B1A]MCA0024505.1 Crp/Fnr family transcriptional regulator [Mesorhizobium sp. B263B1A]MCA0055823.1 Crp/Fnr family transcriptional regulator [Mesorhizobium sp. B261B1A]